MELGPRNTTSVVLACMGALMKQAEVPPPTFRREIPNCMAGWMRMLAEDFNYIADELDRKTFEASKQGPSV